MVPKLFKYSSQVFRKMGIKMKYLNNSVFYTEKQSTMFSIN